MLQAHRPATASSPAPIRTFILKFASRCNLNCSYCFVYNRADTRWRLQPHFMSQATFRQTLVRIREHCGAHGIDGVSIVFHGGEPLLAGAGFLAACAALVDEVLGRAQIKASLGMQSNGLLFSEHIGDVMLEHRMSMGVSLDGPPSVNDLYRVDHEGKPSSLRLEERLALLTSDKYRRVFAGFLCVVNASADPLEVYHYLASFEPPSIDFLLPYDNYDRRPAGKEDLNSTVYADWLIPIFNEWFGNRPRVTVRMFESLLRLVLGSSSLVESLGLDAADLLIVEANGAIEAVDALKAAYDGATQLGYNVFDHTIDAAVTHVFVRSRLAGLTELCQDCRRCPVVTFCGGGYFPNRYSTTRGFDNPSVYCADLYKFIRHVYDAAAGCFAKDHAGAR